MKKLQIFDPALCCSSGVCGTDVDQRLVDFSAEVEWASQRGVTIERLNLAQQPMAFAEATPVKDLLQSQGDAGLPAVLLDGALVFSGRYPTRAELTEWFELGASVFTDQVAELVAIGASIASNCEPCFKYHFDAARKLGVSNADMLSAVDLAQRVKDSPHQAIMSLANRMLKDTESAAAAAVTAAAPAAASTASCCGGTETPTGAKSSCCG